MKNLPKSRGPRRKPAYTDLSQDALFSDSAMFKYLNLTPSTGKRYKKLGLLPPADVVIGDKDFHRLETLQEFARSARRGVGLPAMGRPRNDGQQGVQA